MIAIHIFFILKCLFHLEFDFVQVQNEAMMRHEAFLAPYSVLKQNLFESI